MPMADRVDNEPTKKRRPFRIHVFDDACAQREDVQIARRARSCDDTCSHGVDDGTEQDEADSVGTPCLIRFSDLV